jgi:segregation and condensation protein A
VTLLENPSYNSSDGIEILVTLAKSGKIDPWNIDIVEVTDAFLQTLADMKSQDLKLTGKTLLYAAILLRLKSDALNGIQLLEDVAENTSEDWDDPDFFEPELPRKLNITSLDQVLRRRNSVKQPRNRRVTLEDLIVELQKYEALDKERHLKEAVAKIDNRRMRNYADLSSEDIVELAHDEFIEDTIYHLQLILEKYFIHNQAISLTELETLGRLDRISAFIAILFLCARSEIDLVQEKFYEELYVIPLGAEHAYPVPLQNDDLMLNSAQQHKRAG